MRGATWMLLGLGGVVGSVHGQDFSFTTVMDARSSIDLGDSVEWRLGYVGQVVIEDDNSVAAISRLVEVGNPGNQLNMVTYNASPGTGQAKLVAVEGDAHATFGTSGGGSFENFYNLAAVNGAVTFAAGRDADASQRGLFRYEYDATSPQRSTIFFDGDAVSGETGKLDTGLGLPAYGINASNHVVFSAQTMAPSTPGTQFVARFNGVSSTRIHDASGGIDDFNNEGDTPFPPHKTLTNAGHTVFVGDDTADDDGRRIYDIAPGGPNPPTIRVGATLNSVILPNGGVSISTYEPSRLLAATGDNATGATLFRSFQDRVDPDDNEWTKGALLVKTQGGVQSLGSFDTGATDFGPEVTGVMSDNGRIAAFLPDSGGGHVVYYDAAAGGLPLTIAQFNTNVGGGLTLKDVSLDDVSVPMVNERGTVVFDGVVTDGSNDFDALLAWKVGWTAPRVVIKSGDMVDIGGQLEAVGVPFLTLMPLGPHIVGELGFDGDVLKDGLNDNDYLAFGVWYDQDNNGFPNDGAAILLTQIPEPAAASVIICASVALLARRRRRQSMAA